METMGLTMAEHGRIWVPCSAVSMEYMNQNAMPFMFPQDTNNLGL